MYAIFFLVLAAFVPSKDADAFVLPMRRTTTTASSTSLSMGILNRFRKKKQLKVDPIRPGQKLPEVDVDIVVGHAPSVQNDESDGTTTVATIQEVVGGSGTNLLIGMPGAYTPTCSDSHMPGYLKAADKLKTLGVDTIAVVTTNGTSKGDKLSNIPL